MANDTQSFRSSVLGFDRNDVITYIEALSKEHREEADAFRSATEVLRHERDEAKDALNKHIAELAAVKEEFNAMNAVNEALKAQKAINLQLTERLAQAGEELKAVKQLNGDILKENEKISKTKIRVADMELMAYKRAQEIEKEALQNADKVRSALQRLIRDTKGKYSIAKGETEAVAYNVLQELTRMRDWFDDFPQIFDEIDDTLDSLLPPEKAEKTEKVPQNVKVFVPDSFEAETDKAAHYSMPRNNDPS